MKVFTHKLALLALVLLVFVVQSCHDVPTTDSARPTAHAFDSKVYHQWNNVFLEIERYAKGYRPGPAPRALAYLGVSAYECAVPGIPENNSLSSVYPGLELPNLSQTQEVHWPAAINESYYYLMQRFFFHMENEYPELFGRIEQLHQQLHNQYAAETTTEILERSEQWGHDVAVAVYEWEKLDSEGHNAFLNPQPTDYVPVTGPGKWQPTIPDQARAVYPYWGKVRVFAISEQEKLCKPPVPYSEDPESLFYDQAEEVYKTVNLLNNPTPENAALAYDLRWMAIFWSDDLLNLTFSPPARLLAVADQIVEAEHTDLAGSAELYAKLGMALSDNGVAIWNSKYVYNVERPVSYIRRVISNYEPAAANWQTILDNPLNGVHGMTPAFPAYPSGHSGFGGAGAKILSSFYEFTPTHPGTYGFTDHCHALRNDFIGTPRYFRSLSDLGREDAYSRVPLGVHFRMDCDEGIRVGELCAQRVLELPWKK